MLLSSFWHPMAVGVKWLVLVFWPQIPRKLHKGQEFFFFFPIDDGWSFQRMFFLFSLNVLIAEKHESAWIDEHWIFSP